MAKMMAYCGLDCGSCEAYLATQNGDWAEQQKVLEKWRVDFNVPEMTLAALMCDGCKGGGRLCGLCADCVVRDCAEGRGHATCAACEDYETCATMQDFLVHFPPEAKANLEALRASA